MHEPWRQACERALYGPDGFYRRPGTPARHFRTASVAAAPTLAAALVRLARSAGCTSVVDVGAGGGELLAAVAVVDPDLDLVGVEVAPRPDLLPSRVTWAAEARRPTGPALLVGWELLDAVPSPVLEADGAGVLREVVVDPAGDERLGGEASDADAGWAATWWPGPYRAGDRVEVGLERDAWWEELTEHVVGREGLALAVDYDHARADRPARGSLTGFRDGRVTGPVPDGRHDLTTHVALDAVAARLQGSVRLEQADALRALGVDGRRPDPALAASDPVAYLAGLARTSAASELLDRGGLGGFGWLLSPRGSAATAAVEALAGP